MKLPNGYGSVYKLSGKRRRPWTAVISDGIDDDGKVIRRTLGYYKTRQEGLSALANYHDNPKTPSELTFGNVLDEFIKYRDGHGGLNASYRSALRKYEPLRDSLFVSVKVKNLQEIADKYSASSISQMRSALAGVYKYAIKHEYIGTNYALLIDVPEIPKSTLHVPFTIEELKELWDNKDDISAKLALVLIYTGMRWTELYSLRKENIFDDYVIGGIKTEAGKNRVIPLHNAIKPLFKELQRDGSSFFGNISSAHLRKKVWENSMLSVVQRHLPHDCRHTCETMLDNLGTNKRIIQLILGHAGKDVDDSVYTHKTRGQLIEAINRLPTC